jgi:hypothetical protein
VIAVLVALGAAVPPADAAQLRWGMNPGAEVQDLRLDAADDAGLASMRAVGTTEIRFAAAWRLADPTGRAASGTAAWDWSWFDDDVATAARHGMRWAPFLCWPPDGDTRAPKAPSCGGPATDLDRWSTFVRAFVGRYGPGGAFWAAHPELPRLPVETIEVYNEPNLGEVWPGLLLGPSPAAEYARLYAATRRAVRSVPGGAGVRTMFASLAPVEAGRLSLGEISWASFLEQAVRALPAGEDGAVDAFGFHPYMTNVDQADPVAHVLGHLRAFRSALTVLGRPGAPIDVTELGIATRYDFLPSLFYGRETTARFTEAERTDFYRRVVPAIASADLGVSSVSPLFFSADRDVWDPPTVLDALDINRWLMTIFSIASPDGTLRDSGRAYGAAVAAVDRGDLRVPAQATAPVAPAAVPVAPAAPVPVVPVPTAGGASHAPVPGGAAGAAAREAQAAAARKRAAAKRRAAARRKAAAKRRAVARRKAAAKRRAAARKRAAAKRAAAGGRGTRR